MRPQPKRASFIRKVGQQVLKTLPTYEFDNTNGEYISVTAARRFVRENDIPKCSVIKVRRNAYTIDKYYWCEKGMFSAGFAECNYVNFLELRPIAKQIIDDGLIAPVSDREFYLEIETVNYEYQYA